MSLSRWHADISSPAVSLAKELAKNNRVFFIEHPYSWKDVLSGNARPYNESADQPVRVIRPPVVVPINFLPEGRLYHMLRQFNEKLLANTLRKLIADHKIGRYVFINFFDPYFFSSFEADIRPEKWVYQCMDDMSQVAYTRKHGVRLENETIRKADVVLCTSKKLTRMKSLLSPNVRFHPNAADFELFHTAYISGLERPPELRDIRTKVIGFIGSIEYRTDFELLRKIGEQHADKTIMMIGPVGDTKYEGHRLHELKNIRFIGARPLHSLPAYLRYFDCCIIPYKKNELTSSIYPLKINEYLAAGKPVVATSFSDDIRAFGDVAYIAESHDEFLKLINTSIAENDVTKEAARISVAASNSWTRRVEEFWQLIT
jgi:teichuronic acid biosynthesis glycosyltransferase TuaH